MGVEVKYDNELNSLINDVFVGPDERSDLNANQDKKTKEYYASLGAPFADTLCYSAEDLLSALNDVLDECTQQNVFGNNEDDDEKEDDNVSKVIIVGPLANYYGGFVDECIKDLGIEFIKEQVQNGQDLRIGGRSSGLQHMLQSVVTTH